MRIVNGRQGVIDLAGAHLGPSIWMQVNQEMIDGFAALTGDHQWIHVDPVRAARERPGGKTIAHGFLTLSLLPALQETLLRFENIDRVVNYGLDRLRYPQPVEEGARLRLVQQLSIVEAVKAQGFRIVFDSKLEIEGQPRPALTASLVAIVFPDP